MNAPRRLYATLLSLVLFFSGIIFFGSTAKADSLEVLGGSVTWSDTLYFPDGCSNFAFTYKNNTGVRLLQLGLIITDPYQREVERESEIGIEPNKSGTWNLRMCSYDFNNGLGPYIIKVFVEDYASTQREIQKEIYFQKIPSATPTPTPTVTVTKTPSPAPTVTVTKTPAPAPTVTVTATPAPAPTVTVTATPAPAPTVTVTKTPAPAPTVTVTATPAPAPTVTVTATPAPAPTVTVTATPAPAPTVTVTATPAPAPTVYITNPVDATLTGSVKSLTSNISLLNAKLKKICAVKPKPKGC